VAEKTVDISYGIAMHQSIVVQWVDPAAAAIKTFYSTNLHNIYLIVHVLLTFYHLV